MNTYVLPKKEQAIKELFRLMSDNSIKTETHLTIILKALGIIPVVTKIDYSKL